jgi:hypothetical protein
MTMLLRRQMMREALAASGWKSVSFTAAEDTTTYRYTNPAISAALPASYCYAIALRDDTDDLEDGAFVGAVYLPGRTSPYVLRYKDGTYGSSPNPSNTYTLVLRTGDTLTIWYRTEPITSDVPSTSWNYSCIQPGPVSKASEVKNALSNVDAWAAIISVADIDFRTLPETNNTWCAAIVAQDPVWSGGYIKISNGAYAVGSQWTSAYDLIIDSTTKVSCFYI